MLKPRTTEASMVSFFVALSTFVRSVTVQWLPEGETLFVDPVHGELRHSTFAGAISPFNFLEMLRLHWTSALFPLGSHNDRENPVVLALVAIAGFCIIRRRGGELICLGITGAMRRSISDSFRREGRDLPMAEHIGNVYEATPTIRRRVSARLMEGPQVEFFPGVHMIRNECNFEPTSFHQPYVYYCMILISKFNLMKMSEAFSRCIGRKAPCKADARTS